MKLRNKIHPEIIADFQVNWSLRDEGDKIELRNISSVSKFEYNSIEKLAEEWETVKEPLLKGDLRLAIKIWAEQCGAKLDDVIAYYCYGTYFQFNLSTEDNKGLISNYDFEIPFNLPYLEDEKSYTVKDLVGTE